MSKPRLCDFLNDMRAQTPPRAEYDHDKVDDAVLALLSRTLHQPAPDVAWKRMIGELKHKRTPGALIDGRGTGSGVA